MVGLGAHFHHPCDASFCKENEALAVDPTLLLAERDFMSSTF